MAETSILAEEAERFGKLAADWWDPDGSSAMLHNLNPVRLKYVRDQIDRHWQCDECNRRPLEGKSALDVGCGAGLLAEPLARLGAKVTGIDAAPEVIAVAREHAAARGLDDRLSRERDRGARRPVRPHHLHGSDRACRRPGGVPASLAPRLAPDGLLILSTPNATGWSKLMMITLAEGLGRIPRGTHDFDKFIAPERMKVLLADARLSCVDFEGVAWSPTRGLHLSDDVRLNYLVAAARA